MFPLIVFSWVGPTKGRQATELLVGPQTLAEGASLEGEGGSMSLADCVATDVTIPGSNACLILVCWHKKGGGKFIGGRGTPPLA